MQTTDEKIVDSNPQGDSYGRNGVENIRRDLREAALIKRKEDRACSWNRNRTNLGDCPGDKLLSAEYISDRAKLLKKKQLSLEDYRYLPNALIQSKENINAFLNVDQSLSCLVRDLSGVDPTFQLYSANCCCNIALGNPKACAAVGKAVVPYLLTKMDSLNYILLDVCVWTIGNLVAGSDKAFSILHAQHCLKHLILLLRDCDDSILHSVLYTLLHYVHVGFHLIPKSEMIELVEVIKKRNLMYMHPNCIWLLALLSSSPTCTIHLYPVLSQVVDYLYSILATLDETTHTNEITASVRILANTLYDASEDKVNVLLENPKYSNKDLCSLLNKLLSHSFVHIRKETFWLIGNLYNHRSCDISKNMKDLIPLLPALDLTLSAICS